MDGRAVKSRLVEFLSSPTVQIRWWATWTIMWAMLTPVTLLTGLRSSVPWLEWMSLFANFASCGTALVAAWSYHRARRVDEANLHDKLDHIISNHPDIPPFDGGDS